MNEAVGKGVRRIYEFGSFRLEATERRFLHDGLPVHLPPKAFDTLIVLIENNGRLLTKDELLDKVWKDSFVEENNLTQHIYTLRKVLSNGDGHQYIETVARHGYRFNADVREISWEEPSLLVESQTNVRVVIKEEVREEEFEKGDKRFAFFSFLSERRGVVTLIVTTCVLLALFAVWFVIARNDKQTQNAETKIPITTANKPVIRSLAVLPFKLIGPENNDDYLGVGMADTLIVKLQSIRQLNLRPLTATHKYANMQQDPVAIGRELGVDAVLDGRIQKAEGRIRVTAELIQTSDGKLLWTETLDEESTDIFTLQDRIAQRFARSLPATLTGAENALLTKRYTTNSEAYEAYLQGRYFWNKRTVEGFKKTLEHFQRAIALDPNYAQAYAGIADCYAIGCGLTSVIEAQQKTREAAYKALELDDTLAEPRAALAYHQGALDWDWEGAEINFRRAIELNPNYATARHWHAYNLASMGRVDEAVAEIKRAQEIDPLSLIINTDVGHVLYFARRFDEAIAQYRKVLDMDANFAVAHWRLGEAYVQKGQYKEAITEINKARELDAKDMRLLGWLTHAYAVSGQHTKARELLAELLRRTGHDQAPCYRIAFIHTALGDKEQAFSWLEKAVARRDAEMAPFKVEPMFDNLRADPRYTALLQRMKLMP